LTKKKSANQAPDKMRGSVERPTEPSFLIIGQITKPHGVNGEMRVQPHTDLPARFTWLDVVYIGESEPRPYEVTGVRLHKNMVLLKLAGFNNRNDAESLRGQLLQVPENEALPLEDGEYYLFQLLGLQVVTDQGLELGKLVEVIETGANHVFRVSGVGQEVLLPDIDDVILDIDFDNGRMTVHLLPGLLPD